MSRMAGASSRPATGPNFDEHLRVLLRELVREELARVLADRQTPTEYLTVQQAAAVAGVARGTIRRWVREGRLTDYRAGRVVRVRRDELEHMLLGQRRRGGLTPEQQADLDFEGRR